MTSKPRLMHYRNRGVLLVLGGSLITASLSLSYLALVVRTEMLPSLVFGIILIVTGLGMSKQLFQTLISPFTFYLIPWGFVLALHALFLSDYYLAPLLSITYIALFVSVVGFVAGGIVAQERSVRQTYYFRRRDSERGVLNNWNLDKFHDIIVVLFVVGFIAAAYQTFRMGGLLALVSDPNKGRFLFWRTESGYFFGLLANAVLFSAYYQLAIRRISWKLLLASGVALVWMILPGSRTLAFFALGQTAILWLMYRQRIDYRSFLVVVILVLIFSGVTDYRTQGQSGDLALIERGLVQIDTRLNWLVNPYLYFVTPIQNLQQNLLYPSEFTWGVRLFRPIIAVLQLDSGLNYGIRLYSGSYNVATYLVDLYQDYGWVGMVTVSTLMGYFSTKFFLRSLSPKYLLISVLFLYVLALSIFSNYLGNTSVWISFVLIFATERLCRRRYAEKELDVAK